MGEKSPENRVESKPEIKPRPEKTDLLRGLGSAAIKGTNKGK